jgi:hypothetical protein
MSDLRTRISQMIWQRWVTDMGMSMPTGMADKLADAVIAELDLEKRITSAVQGYAQSELVGIDYHDPMHHETAYGAMEKLNREAVGIAKYAMKYRPDWKADDE